MGKNSIYEDLNYWKKLMNIEDFKDIAPYKGQDAIDAVNRILGRDDLIYSLVEGLVSGDSQEDKQKRAYFVSVIREALKDIKSYTDFQKKITAGYLIPAVMQKTVDNFTVSGAERLDPNTAYMYISNHRDIILDCGLLDLGLLQNGLPLCEMAIGDNLLANSFVLDLFKLNGAVIVKRNLTVREKYLETVRLSEYFVGAVTEENTSVWIAQKSGRSKDGIDETHPSIIKMFYLAQKKTGISFSDLINKIRIVPVAISYQYDPNDINKAREEISSQKKGVYEKKKFEDLISMFRGLRHYKGNIHISLGTPLEGEFADATEVAKLVDKQIHQSYHLWDTNYFAYDYLEGTTKFKDEYKDFNSEAFLAKYAHLEDDTRNFVLASYANPVRMYLKSFDE